MSSIDRIVSRHGHTRFCCFLNFFLYFYFISSPIFIFFFSSFSLLSLFFPWVFFFFVCLGFRNENCKHSSLRRRGKFLLLHVQTKEGRMSLYKNEGRKIEMKKKMCEKVCGLLLTPNRGAEFATLFIKNLTWCIRNLSFFFFIFLSTGEKNISK